MSIPETKHLNSCFTMELTIEGWDFMSTKNLKKLGEIDYEGVGDYKLTIFKNNFENHEHNKETIEEMKSIAKHFADGYSSPLKVVEEIE